MMRRLMISFILTALISIANVRGQCTNCTSDQGCCMSLAQKEWSCCVGQPLALNDQENTPWNFNMQINYDVYVWGCSSSNMDPLQKYTNVSCLLDGRWSLDRLNFQLKSIPTNELKFIVAEYTMKNSQPEKVVFQADSQWALTLPVDRNVKPDIYDELKFSYGSFNYTYYFGYGPYPHCPRC